MDIENLQKICKSLSAVTEDIKWEHDLCFSVGAKMFCVTSLEPPFNCSFKVKDEEFEELSTREGFMPTKYMARAKWVTADNSSKLTKEEWKAFVKQSYELVKSKLTKKLREELGLR